MATEEADKNQMRVEKERWLPAKHGHAIGERKHHVTGQKKLLSDSWNYWMLIVVLCESKASDSLSLRNMVL